MVNSLYRVVFPVSNKTLNSGDCRGKEHSMKELSIINHNGIEVVDSREVAEMIGKQHAHLMRDIKGYAEIIGSSIESNFGLNDFFIESQYKDSIGRTLPCYLLTKKGCDMVANKMTGEKGVLFTAAYVTAFEKMRETLTEKKPMTQAELILAQSQLMVEQERRLKALENRAERNEQTMQKTLDIFSAPAVSPDDWTSAMNHQINTLVEQYGGNHRKFRSDRYAELELETGVDLKCRQTRLRNRMRKNGATETECKQVSILQVISRDRKLRPAFEAIIRRKAASLISDAQM